MNEKDNFQTEKADHIRSMHLVIVTVATFGAIGLISAGTTLKWEFWITPILVISTVAVWIIHISQLWTEEIRERCYMIYIMIEVFFHGVHATSFFDVALMACLMMVTFSLTDNIKLIKYSFLEYLLILVMQFYLEYREDLITFDALNISRLLLHVFTAVIVYRVCLYTVSRRIIYSDTIDEYKEQVKKRDNEMEDFLTNISHELRTPVNVVNGISTLMMKDDDGDNIRQIHNAGIRMAGQIEDILDYTEIDSGKLMLEYDKYIISSLINDIVVNLRLKSEKDLPEFIIDLDPVVPLTLKGDVKKLRKIIEQLLNNAVKFTKRGGICLKIKSEPRDYGINLDITVSDTGIGMSKSEIQRSTRGFFQADKSRDRSSGGIGLGLTIVYGFVHAMGGFVNIESEPGRGTTVTVSIPQEVIDPSPCLSVDPNVDRFVVSYIKPEKYSVPALRDYNQSMAENIARGLKIHLHNAANIKDLKTLCENNPVTHIFMGREEYEEDTAYFNDLSKQNVCVAVSSDEMLNIPRDSKVICMPKPLYGFPITKILNAGDDYDKVVVDDLSGKKVSFDGVKALIVDDERMNLVVASGLFKDYRMDIDTADSGADALEKYRNNNYDVIFMDHMMPEMDGVETLHRIREIGKETGRDTLVVALTANAVSGARELFMSEGFDGFISKPIEIGEFERVMKRILPVSMVIYDGGN
ncbi:MAG: response regulator [Lachnospiraceae bacterium]|nr:response regulator [Lachnospiraceae bacterium]